MKHHIHINIADRGWILEKCAHEIALRSENVTFGTSADARADLQYYINYSARRQRVSSVELALFTHLEVDDNAAKRFFATAHDLDAVVCMSDRYRRVLENDGVGDISVIAPGVDLELFKPKIRVGVVGRTYHTGRKGEALVSEVMDTPGIEWRFTGTGWPGPAINVPGELMPDFYNDLDYVLVPSLYEGGPMSVLEGLACGVPIISSDVGWVSEYPHIPFETGNADSLRKVLTSLLEERATLRSAVLTKTWDNWAEEHLELFDRVLATPRASVMSRAITAQPDKRKPFKHSVTLALHGGEGATLGGPSVRVPRTAVELENVGVSSSLLSNCADNLPKGEIVHIFNVWPVESCLNLIAQAQNAGKKVVLSPIYLNLSDLDTYSRKVPEILSNMSETAGPGLAMAALAGELDGAGAPPSGEPYAGYHSRVLACIEAADQVICLSDYEQRCLVHLGADQQKLNVVTNPVDGLWFGAGDAEAFRSRFGVEDYILSVGRIESRKNQLALAHVASRLKKNLVLIGHIGNQRYANLVQKAGGEYLTIIPRLENHDPAFLGAFAGADVFCLPSWAEGAPLAALEAAAAGLPLVVSDRAAEREYFGEFARYVNPADLLGLEHAVESAATEKSDLARSLKLKQHMLESHNWEAYARKTRAVYEKVSVTSGTPLAEEVRETQIYFDLTTSAHFEGNPTGIARVEERAYRAFVSTAGERVIPIAWNSRTKNFLRLKRSDSFLALSLDLLDDLEKQGKADVISPQSELAAGQVIVVGGAWIRNPRYVRSLRRLRSRSGLGLTVLVHDLIQMKLSHIYPQGAGDEFAANAELVVESADSFLVYSEATRFDLSEFLLAQGMSFKKIDKFRLGDMTDLGVATDQDDQENQLKDRFDGVDFVLYVSSIDVRKNHLLLINIWRRLIEQRGASAPHLVLVGRSLWRGDEIVDLIRREPRLSSFVHLLTDTDDQDLHWLYENCRFTVYPSLYEGWGLPVVESLSFGKLCLCSDRSSTKEIAPHLTDRLDPYDFRAWCDRIALYLDNPQHLANREQKIRDEFVETTWETSVQEITRCVDALPHFEENLPRVLASSVMRFDAINQGANEPIVCSTGWDLPDKTGRWMLGERAALVFDYLGPGNGAVIRLQLASFCESKNSGRYFKLSINGAASQTIFVPDESQEFDFPIVLSPTATGVCRKIVVTIEACDLVSPRALGISNDGRELGVKLYKLSVGASIEDLEKIAPEMPKASANPKNTTQVVAKVPATLGVSGLVVDDLNMSRNDRLLEALARLDIPRRLPPTRRTYRLLRALGVDIVVIAVYRRLFARTHDGIRRVIQVVSADRS